MVILTEQLIQYNNEFNIKLFLLLVLFIYSLAGLYFGSKIKPDEYYKQIIKYIGLIIPSSLYLFSFPLYSIFLFNKVSVEALLIPVFSYYGVVYTIGFLIFMVYGTKKVLNLVGIDWKPSTDFKRGYEK